MPNFGNMGSGAILFIFIGEGSGSVFQRTRFFPRAFLADIFSGLFFVRIAVLFAAVFSAFLAVL